MKLALNDLIDKSFINRIEVKAKRKKTKVLN